MALILLNRAHGGFRDRGICTAVCEGTALAEPTTTGRQRRILNHDIMGCTADGVVGNHLYSGRALAVSEPGDLVQMHPDLTGQWEHVTTHYRRIGLSHSDAVLWDLSHERLAERPDYELSVFFFGADEHAARPDPGWFHAVQAINSKNTFMSLAAELGVPVPLTTPFERAGDITAADIAAAPCPCYIKAALSVSGIGIHRCADAAELRAAIGRFAPDTPVQIQEEVVTDCFLNLQYSATENGPARHAATEQVLNGFVHQGNRHPAAHAPWEAVEPMAHWLHAEGMRGVYAFDVAVVGDAAAPRFLAIECNPRYNGASYPTAVAHKLGIAHWLAKAFPTRHRTLADLDLTGIEYDPDTGTGIVLVNWGPILVGKLLVLLAGSPEQQQALERVLLQRL
jgi:hypothetical protein